MVGYGLYGVDQPEIPGHRRLTGLEYHALLVDLRPPLLVARVYAELLAGYLGVVGLQSLRHRFEAGLDLPAEIHDLLDQLIQFTVKGLARHLLNSLAESTGHVVFSLLALWRGEHLIRIVELPELARIAHVLDVEEAGVVRDARRLLHVVRHDHHRVALLELLHRVLDLLCRDRVQSTRWLIHQDDFGF